MDEWDGPKGLDPGKFGLSEEDKDELLDEIEKEKARITDHKWQMRLHQRRLIDLLGVAQAAGLPLGLPELYELYGLVPNPSESKASGTPTGKPYKLRSRSRTNLAAAARILKYLNDNGLTQVVFAEDVGISPTTLIALLNRGKASRTVWTKVAMQMKTSVEELLKEPPE